MPSNGIRFDSGQLRAGLRAYDVAVERAVAGAAEWGASMGESLMKQNAPWIDRTTNARNGLRGTALHDAPWASSGGTKTHTIVLAHSVPYGIWLEVRWSGRYAIILPTIEQLGPRVMNMVGTLIGGGGNATGSV